MTWVWLAVAWGVVAVVLALLVGRVIRWGGDDPPDRWGDRW